MTSALADLLKAVNENKDAWSGFFKTITDGFGEIARLPQTMDAAFTIMDQWGKERGIVPKDPATRRAQGDAIMNMALGRPPATRETTGIPPGMKRSRPGFFIDPADGMEYPIGTPMNQGIEWGPKGLQAMAEMRNRVREMGQVDVDRMAGEDAFGVSMMAEQQRTSFERESGKIIEEVDKTTDAIAERWQRVGWTMGASMGQAADAMIWEHQKAADAINDILRNLANDMMYQWIFQPLGDQMGLGMSKMFKRPGTPVGEKGAADGMIATSPTRMLFGEAGPEAAMPLVRGPGGKLGVANYGGGGGAPTIQIINQSSQPVTARVGDIRQDINGTITQVILDDARDGGPISQTLSGQARG
jgi:hypothetical protein